MTSNENIEQLQVVRYIDFDNNSRIAIEVPAPPFGKHIEKYHYIIPMNSEGIAVRRVFRPENSPGELRGKRVMREHIKPYEYPIAPAARNFLAAGERFGITNQAKAYLEGKAMSRKSKKGKSTQRPDKILPRTAKANGKSNGKKRGVSMSQKIREACSPLFVNGRKPERQALIAACVKAGMKAEVLSHHSINSVHALIKRGA